VCNILNTLLQGTCDILFTWTIKLQRHFQTRCKFGYMTLWSRILLEKITSPQLVKQFPKFHGTWRFITTFTTASYLSLSWARSIKSIPHATSWRYILILFPHLCLGLLSGLLPPGVPTKTLCAPLLYSVHATWSAHLTLFDLSAEKNLVRSVDHKVPCYVTFSMS
jgi:hypothetical protein